MKEMKKKKRRNKKKEGEAKLEEWCSGGKLLQCGDAARRRLEETDDRRLRTDTIVP